MNMLHWWGYKRGSFGDLNMILCRKKLKKVEFGYANKKGGHCRKKEEIFKVNIPIPVGYKIHGGE